MARLAKQRYLTKSRYQMALECPSKLFYAGKPKEYADASIDNPFLMALARGGFQVGALAKCYYPDGVEVAETDHDKAIAETDRLLQRDDVTIFEAAIRYENLFVRIDILRKVGKTIEIIEVKSKSFDPRGENPFFDKTALKKNIFKLNSDFAPYLYDVAFQAFVVMKAHSGRSVSSSLLLANKATTTSVDGLNQLFLLKDSQNGRATVITKPGLNQTDLGNDILCKVNVDEVVAIIHEGRNTERAPEDRCQGLGYEAEIEFFASKYATDEKIASKPGSHCKQCEFRADATNDLKSGFNECWQKEMKVRSPDLAEPFVFDIWNFRRSSKLIEDGKVFIKDLVEEDIAPKAKNGEGGLSMSQRQWLQVEKVQSKKAEPYVDKRALSEEFASWTFPLHFIDFETTTVAIPFHKGRRPYEVIAFQFSHHIIHQDGSVEHADQYLNTNRGKFPNFDFVRSLKKALEKDDGTIFRYAAHENTVLCQIHDQLRNSDESDALELMAWIKTITTSGSSSIEKWDGPRSMVDMCDLVKRYYYHPMTRGSNSIKKVLPAILSASRTLLTRYSKPMYGAKDGLRSLNFKDWTWIVTGTDGTAEDPYGRLPPISKGLDRNEMDQLFGDEELADGGAAMITYSMMQFTEMSEPERSALASALLRYCELDTLAMVMLYEYWADLLGFVKSEKVA